MNKNAGKGKTSNVPTELHTIQYSGKYWQSQQDVDEFRAKKMLLNEARRHGYDASTLDQYLEDKAAGKVKVVKKGLGVCSTKPTALHQVWGDGKWWRTTEDLHNYRKRQALVKRAKKAGYDYTQVDDFLEIEKATHDAVDLTIRRERRDKDAMNRLKAKYGLPSHANRRHLNALFARTKDEEIARVLNMISQRNDTDADRVARIRKLFLSGAAPYDILYQTALIVGINLRKKA
jgi:hypothetical protein